MKNTFMLFVVVVAVVFGMSVQKPNINKIDGYNDWLLYKGDNIVNIARIIPDGNIIIYNGEYYISPEYAETISEACTGYAVSPKIQIPELSIVAANE